MSKYQEPRNLQEAKEMDARTGRSILGLVGWVAKGIFVLFLLICVIILLGIYINNSSIGAGFSPVTKGLS